MQKSCVGPWRWLSPPTPLFCVGDTNMLVSENAKICVSPDAKHKIGVSSDAKPLCVGHVYFIFYVLISFQWVADANAVFSGICAL